MPQEKQITESGGILLLKIVLAEKYEEKATKKEESKFCTGKVYKEKQNEKVLKALCQSIVKTLPGISRVKLYLCNPKISHDYVSDLF